MNKNTDNFGNVIPEGWELDPVWGNINGAIKPIAKPTDFGAPRPDGSSPLWNDWAANNPTPQAKALGQANIASNLADSLLNSRGILGSAARPIEK